MSKTFRILMANRPRLMRELLVEMLQEEPWIEIVGEITQESEIRQVVRETVPDLLVVTAGARGRRPPICDELLQEFLTLRIIAVAPHENYAVCYWASLEIHAEDIESSKALDIHAEDIESSEDGFLGAVKKAAQVSSCGSQVN
jgi:chemotaxis response regulator CheB